MDIQVLDCTIRDGGYLNNWRFEENMVRELYLAAGRAGIDIVELGWRGTERFFSRETYGPWRFTTESDLRKIIQGTKRPKIATMSYFGKIQAEDFVKKEDSCIDLVRICVDRDNIGPCISLLKKIKPLEYEVSLNITGFSNFSSWDISELSSMIKDSDLDYVYVADSYGSMMPEEVPGFIEPLVNLPNIRVGFHPHNSLQLAFANTLEAIKSGVDVIDSTVFGMGRGAGNLTSSKSSLFAYKHLFIFATDYC